jgi:hypothetical protein
MVQLEDIALTRHRRTIRRPELRSRNLKGNRAMGQANFCPTVLVNVEHVLGHCRAEHQAGAFGKRRYGDYVPAMKLAIDAYLEHPKNSAEQLLFTVQARYDLQCDWSIPQWHEGPRDAAMAVLRFLGVATTADYAADIGEHLAFS